MITLLLSVALTSFRLKLDFMGKFWLALQIGFEILEKKKISQKHFEIFLILTGSLLLWFLRVNFIFFVIEEALILIIYLALVAYNLMLEKNILNANMIYFWNEINGNIEAPHPLPHFIILFRGPFWKHHPVYELGDIPFGEKIQIKGIILNPSEIPSRIKYVTISLVNPAKEKVKVKYPERVTAPNSGEVSEFKIEIIPQQIIEKQIKLKFMFLIDKIKIQKELRIKSIFSSSNIEKVKITRWKYGARAAFAWRGDMDLHDPTTYQSKEGLIKTLELSRRFRIPSTLYLSGRLSLMEPELEEFGNYLGHQYFPESIEEFVDFLKKEVNLKEDEEFPYSLNGKKYSLELGNHMYLHYGTYTSMCKDNNWTPKAMPGEFVYSWQKTRPYNSLNQQYDNIIMNQDLFQKTFKISAKSWGVPGRTNDKFTKYALLKAGIYVGSDASGNLLDNIWRLNVPEHPENSNLVEVHKVYPGDPRKLRHHYMLKYWLNYALKHKKGFVYMAHHHLRLYEGKMCFQLTQEIFRHVLEDKSGDFWITTIYGMANYWENILCEKHRKIEIKHEGSSWYIINNSNLKLEGIPVEIYYENKKQKMLLIDLEPNSKVKLK